MGSMMKSQFEGIKTDDWVWFSNKLLDLAFDKEKSNFSNRVSNIISFSDEKNKRNRKITESSTAVKASVSNIIRL